MEMGVGDIGSVGQILVLYMGVLDGKREDQVETEWVE